MLPRVGRLTCVFWCSQGPVDRCPTALALSAVKNRRCSVIRYDKLPVSDGTDIQLTSLFAIGVSQSLHYSLSQGSNFPHSFYRSELEAIHPRQKTLTVILNDRKPRWESNSGILNNREKIPASVTIFKYLITSPYRIRVLFRRFLLSKHSSSPNIPSKPQSHHFAIKNMSIPHNNALCFSRHHNSLNPNTSTRASCGHYSSLTTTSSPPRHRMGSVIMDRNCALGWYPLDHKDWDFLQSAHPGFFPLKQWVFSCSHWYFEEFLVVILKKRCYAGTDGTDGGILERSAGACHVLRHSDMAATLNKHRVLSNPTGG